MTVVNDSVRFPDDMHTVWNAGDIADVLREKYITATTNLNSRAEDVKESVGGAWGWLKGSKKGGDVDVEKGKGNGKNHHVLPATNIDYLITFDDRGVSSHPNHISLNHGAKEFIKQLQRESGGEKSPPHVPRLYTLSSVNIFRKYTAMMDILTTRYLIGKQARSIAAAEKKSLGVESFGTWLSNLPFILKAHATTKDGLELMEGDWLMFQNNVVRYRMARGAMTEAHKSQMVWFRHGWIALSRYMYVNDIRRVYVNEE